MSSPGRQGPGHRWHPQGSGLLVGVVVLSALALLVHGGIALTLLRGTVHPASAHPSNGSGPVAAPTSSTPTPGQIPAPTPTSTPTSTPTATRGGGTALPSPSNGGAAFPLHLDHGCLRADNPPTGARIPSTDPFGSTLDDQFGAAAELQRLYAVQGGQLVPIDGAGPVRDCDRQLWAVVTAATPPGALRYIDELLVFDADLTSGGALYVGEVSAQEHTTEASSHWRLSLAPNDATDADVALTVAHEVGHLLSLNKDQMTGDSDESHCGTVFFAGGCLRDDASLLRFFYDDTWTDDVRQAWEDADAITDDNQRADALQKVYDDHSSQFVDSYAATDPTEDFAESFGIWCAVGPSSPLLPDVIEGEPTDGKDKLAWFERPGNPVAQQARGQCEALRALTR